MRLTVFSFARSTCSSLLNWRFCSSSYRYFPKSITRATGGSACAATSTRSRFLPYAYSRASSVVLMPSCSPFSPISRTLGTRIASLMRVWGSGRRGGSNPARLRGLKCLSPSSSFPPSVMKKPLVCSGRRSRQPARSRTQIEPPKRELGGERRFRPCLPGTQGSKFCPEIGQRKGGLPAAVLADRERVVGLLVAVDDHIGDLLQLRVPDPLADGVVRVVDFDAVAVQLRREVAGRLGVALADRNDPDLDRGEPEREGAGVVLGEDAGKPLERTEQRAV